MYRCISKIRDKQGRILTYYLMDELTGNTMHVKPKDLRLALLNDKVVVRNLKITSDGRRIIDAITTGPTDTKVKSGKTPSDEQMAKMMTFIEKELLNMGDFYAEIVASVLALADMTEDAYDFEDEEDELTKLEINAIKIILRHKVEYLSDYADYCLENKNILCRRIVYHGNREINKNPIILAINGIASYINMLVNQGKLPKSVLDNILEVRSDLNKIDLKACVFGYNVANTYFKNLDSNIFNCSSNTANVVGSVITDEDEVEANELGFGKYLTHMDFRGASDKGISTVFKQDSTGNIVAYLYKHERKLNGRFYGDYMYTYSNEKILFNNSTAVEEAGKQLAQKIQKLAHSMK